MHSTEESHIGLEQHYVDYDTILQWIMTIGYFIFSGWEKHLEWTLNVMLTVDISGSGRWVTPGEWEWELANHLLKSQDAL